MSEEVKVIYESKQGGYLFQFTTGNVIEVWSDKDTEYPLTYIKGDKIKYRKDFDMEIGFWLIEHQ